MNATPVDTVSTAPISLRASVSTLIRAAMIVAGLYLALAIGAPWLLHDAPPSAEDVLVSCKTGALTIAARPSTDRGSPAADCGR